MYLGLSVISAEQARAFKQASGAEISHLDVQEFLALLFAVLLLLWWAWLIISQYRLFLSDKESLATIGHNILRSSLIVMFLFFLIVKLRG